VIKTWSFRRKNKSIWNKFWVRRIRKICVEGSRSEFADDRVCYMHIRYRHTIRKWWRWCMRAKVTLVLHIECALKLEMKRILDHVAIRDARRATKRAYQRTKRHLLRMYALRSQLGRSKTFDYSLFVRTC